LLVPRTFRFDKYQFHTRKKLESVPRPDASRAVGKTAAVPEKKERQGKVSEEQLRQDTYGEFAEFPEEWTQQYFRRRTLWSPRDERELRHGPAKILLFWEGDSLTEGEVGPCLELAEHYHSQLTLLEILPLAEAASLEVRKQQLGPLTRGFPISEIQVRSHPNPLEVLLETISQESYAMVALGMKNPDLVAKVVKESPVPVLVLAPESKHAIQKVLVPVEGTRFSYPAISQAMILSEDFAAELLLFQVGKETSGEFPKIMEKMSWKNIKHDFFEGAGEVSGAIAQFAREQEVDLIVMGTHGVLPGSTGLPPSVTLEVMEKAQLPLYVVHP